MLAPVVAAAAVDDGSTVLVRAVGHIESLGRDPELQAEVQRIAGLVRDLEQLSDDDLRSWEGIVRVLQLGRDVTAAVRGVESVVRDPVLAARAQRLGVELAEHLLALYLRTYHPHLFRTAAALTLITAAEHTDAEPIAIEDSAVTRMPWRRDRLHFDRVSPLAQDAPGTLRAQYLPGEMRVPGDAHLAAERLFPLLGDVAAALNLGWFVDLIRVAPEVPLPSGPDPPETDPQPDDEPPPDTGPVDLAAFHRDFVPRFGVYLPRDIGDGGPQPPRFGLSVVASSAQHPDGVRGFVLMPAGEFGWTETRGRWRVTASSEGAVPAFSVGPDGVRILPGAPQAQILAALTVERIPAPGTPAFVLGAVDGTRAEIGVLRLAAGAVVSADRNALSVSVEAGSTTLVLAAEPDDGFLGAVLPDGGVRVPFGLGVILSSDRGVELRGGAGLALTLPIQYTVGPVTVRQVRIEVRADGDTTSLALDGTVAVQLGPIEVAVEGLGMRLNASAPASGGSLGPLELDAGFQWPSGAALAVAAGPISGGGAARYDQDTGSYSGALALSLQQVSIRAVALLDTRLPGGQRGFSLLVALSARLFPGIQLGFGITLTGVGGLVGVNRRIDVDALRERFANGSAGRLLAAEDPLRDLPALLTELSAVFPPAEGVYVVGPTLQLQWAKLVTLDVGVFFEFPGPTRVVVLGTARASIDNPLANGPLLRLQCDFLGVVDLARRTFAFDAVLVDSRLLESFPVTGGLMVRASWGNEPYTMFSVGGFHPDFAPGSLVLPKTLTRLAMSSGSPDDALFLRFEGYFAITSNTVQFGASVEVAAKLGPLRVHGFLGFDALIRFEPFYFQISFETGMRVQWRGRNLAGITVKGSLSGPGPVKFTGKACIEVLFFDICATASFELGSDAPPAVNPVSSALDILSTELRDPANLRAVADDPMVTLRALPVSGVPVLAPTGIVWEQTRAPIGLLLERFEGSPLRRAEAVEVAGDAVSGAEHDWFAPGSFAELSDAEALIRRSFERLQSGVRLAAGDDDRSEGRPHVVDVVEVLIPAPASVPPRGLPSFEAPSWLVEAAQVREGRSDGRRPPPAIVVDPERWQVVDFDGRPLAATGEAQAHQVARALRRAVAVPAVDRVDIEL